MPDEWVDEDTGHKIIRLSKGVKDARSFYFHNNPFIKGENGTNDLMVFFGDVNDSREIFTVNLQTKEVEQITSDSRNKRGEIVGKKGKEVYYQHKDSVFAANVITKNIRLVYVFPEDFKAGVSTLNIEENLLAGSYGEPLKDSIYKANPNKSDYFNLIYDAKIPHTLFTIDIASGELTKIHHERAWLNHLQFSPTNPDLLLYDHEGPWHKVDRIWTIDVKTSENQLMHERTMNREIAGHDFWSRDGKKIWYDLQRPRGETFALAGVDIETMEKTIYKMKRNEWSIHFNTSPDQKLFAGDGGDETQVASATDGQWIYLFTPSGDSLISEKLVNMENHGYRPLEPNVHFSPDQKWIIFRSDLDGSRDVYAVEIAKPQ